MVALDTVGILARWQMLDHWAHLGGTGFGWWYATRGRQAIWENERLRDWLVQQRQEIAEILGRQ